MSNAAAAVLEPETVDDWIELEDCPPELSPESGESVDDPLIELEPTVVYATHQDMRFGPREYTATQERQIERVVRNRAPLSEPPLPIG